jgi:polyisoprenoid-binding protein YceI
MGHLEAKQLRHLDQSGVTGKKTDGEVTLDNKAAKTGLRSMSPSTPGVHQHWRSTIQLTSKARTFRWPTATMTLWATEIKNLAATKSLEVAGNMTIRGKTNPAVQKATLPQLLRKPSPEAGGMRRDFETVVKPGTYDVNWGIAESSPQTTSGHDSGRSRQTIRRKPFSRHRFVG